MRLLQSAFIHHLGFWALSFGILYYAFTRNYHLGFGDVLYTLLFHVPLIVVVALHQKLIERLLISGRRFIYAIGTMTLVAIGIALHYVTFDIINPLILPQYYFVTTYRPVEIGFVILAYCLANLLFVLSRRWIIDQKKQLILEKEKHLIELSSLKNQINPHFLFNSINNIYSKVKPDNQVVRHYMNRLADALRYMIYDTSDELVLLEKEIDYLRNYVELEKLRLEDPDCVQFRIEGDISGYVIAPLILLPLIENCFKHADKHDPDINIFILVDNMNLRLSTSNHVSSQPRKGGFGLQNLRQRLELAYPGKHVFTFDNQGSTFHTTLKINLNQ